MGVTVNVINRQHDCLIVDFTQPNDCTHVVKGEIIDERCAELGLRFTKYGHEAGDEAMDAFVGDYEQFKQRRELMYKKILVE